MTENHKTNSYSELFKDLSEEEQESLTAGQRGNSLGEINHFLQQTNMQTGANNMNVTGGDFSYQNTKYSFSQITAGTSMSFVLPKFEMGDIWHNLISNLFQIFS